MLQGNCKFELNGNRLAIEAIPKADFFVNPVDGSVKADAAFVYEEVEGDFICRAKITLEHKSMFDAGVLLALQDDAHWAKACFEMGDYGFKSVCCVMTNGLSDDGNGITVDGNTIWLQLARTGNVFSVHYSLDGTHFYMARLCSMPLSKKLKVGFVSQSPAGNGVKALFEDFSIENKGLRNPRAGI